MMTEPRSYRPERPVAPITQPATKPKADAPTKPPEEERKLLEDYRKAVERCGTGRVVLDRASGFYVPELDRDCIKGPEKDGG
jgi:hypothetical protein